MSYHKGLLDAFNQYKVAGAFIRPNTTWRDFLLGDIHTGFSRFRDQLKTKTLSAPGGLFHQVLFPRGKTPLGTFGWNALAWGAPALTGYNLLRGRGDPNKSKEQQFGRIVGDIVGGSYGARLGGIPGALLGGLAGGGLGELAGRMVNSRPMGQPMPVVVDPMLQQGQQI